MEYAERAASVASLPAWPASPHGADLDKLLAEPPTEPSASRIMTGIWPAAFSLFLSVGTSILVFPFFTFVPTSGYLGSMLPQVRRWAMLPRPPPLFAPSDAQQGCSHQGELACFLDERPVLLLGQEVSKLLNRDSRPIKSRWPVALFEV